MRLFSLLSVLAIGVVVGSAEAQAPQNRIVSADSLFKVSELPAVANGAVGMLCGASEIVTTSMIPIFLCVFDDYDRPVFIAGRVRTVDDWGNSQVGKAFYASRTLSLSEYGPGWFPGLRHGAIIPVGEIATGNAGDFTQVEVVISDAITGRPVGPTLKTSFCSRIKGAEKVNRVAIATMELAPDGRATLFGNFPVGEPVKVQIGDPEWDSGVVSVVSVDGRRLGFPLPPGKTGNMLYPRGWSVVAVWGVTILTQDGESFGFPSLKVMGNSANWGVAVVK